MEQYSPEWEREAQRLTQTIALASAQLEQAKRSNENQKQEIIEAKREMRENTAHSISSLSSSEGFEELAALSQYVNPILTQLADVEATENRIASLTRLIESPYFARIDFLFDDEDDAPENVYIGRASLMDEDSYEMRVYDWRSPIASIFYRFVMGRAFYEAPNGRITGTVQLKRQYEIKKGVLEYFFDADVQIVDEFLRKLLSQNTSAKMKTIVETIQKEQDLVIRDMENDLLMVQGVAGSGKTSIALHRAAYLMYQGLSAKLSAENIIIISPNALFERYISNVLPELGEEHVISVVLEDILAAVLQKKRIQSRNQFLEVLLTGAPYMAAVKRGIEFKTSATFLEILDRFIRDLPNRWIPFRDITCGGVCIMTQAQLRERIITGREDTPLGLRLMQLEELIIESANGYGEARKSRSEIAALKKEVQSFTTLDVEALYRGLVSDEAYFCGLAEGLALPRDISRILRLTREHLCAHTLSYDDAAVLAYLRLKLNRVKPYGNIRQVVIDEAQDYYPLHYEIFRLLFASAKYTVLGDINQTIEKQEDTSLYEQVAAILGKKKSTLVTMDKSFRCTNEILRYSTKFLAHDPKIRSFNRSGREPGVTAAADAVSLREAVLAEINACLEAGYRSIGLVCKTEKNAHALYERLKDHTDAQLVRHDSAADLQGVFIIPVYMSKGLEFDAVLVCDADHETYRSAGDKKLLYVACTRALHRLNLFCEGEPSSFL